jgi:prepilin-type N-terminal cleavage/methylation domain-containing protein
MMPLDVGRDWDSDLMGRIRYTRGFTLVELLVGLLVTSIILSAVATLAFALSSAERVSGDTAFTQAQLRQATLRLGELIGQGKLLCAAPGNDLVVWRADDNGNKQIDVNEVVYIERGADANMLRLCRFSAAGHVTKTLSELQLPETKAQLLSSYTPLYVPLIPECRNVTFRYDVPSPLPRAKLLAISFDLTESNVVHRYEITAALHAWAGHLLNAPGDALVLSDDD